MEKKDEVKKLAEELLVDRKNGIQKLSEKVVKEADAFCEGYKKFLDNGKTEREVVKISIEDAKKAGFTEYDSAKKYNAGDKIYVNNRGRALMLAVIGTNGCKDGVRISAAHIDAPRIDLKPHPLYEEKELAWFKTHYYGGIKKYQWTTIPLAMHGTVVRKDGTSIDISVGEKEGEPQFCITDILPHLGSEQSAKKLGTAFDGEMLNILVGSRPLRADEGDNLFKLNIMKILHETYNITEEDFVSADIEFVPAFRASDIGFDRSLIGSYAHDDRVCAYPSLVAALEVKAPVNTVISVLADKEEVGSSGNTGLNSAFMCDFIEDLAQAEGLELRHVLAKTECLSADVSAAFDPNYASMYEVNNSTYVNNGVAMSKYTGSRGKGGTSEASAEFVAKVRNLFDTNDVLWQIGELGRVDGGGGGTVAIYLANQNIDVVDIGVPVLSMHAPFEVVSKTDVYMTYQAIKAFYEAK